MKVIINDKIYCSSDLPIIIVLEDRDKENISNMHPEHHCYASFPDGWGSREQMIAWMEEHAH